MLALPCSAKPYTYAVDRPSISIGYRARKEMGMMYSGWARRYVTGEWKDRRRACCACRTPAGHVSKQGPSDAQAAFLFILPTFSRGSTTPPLSRGSIEQVPDVSRVRKSQQAPGCKAQVETGERRVRAIEFVYCLVQAMISSSVCTSGPGLCSRAAHTHKLARH